MNKPLHLLGVSSNLNPSKFELFWAAVTLFSTTHTICAVHHPNIFHLQHTILDAFLRPCFFTKSYIPVVIAETTLGCSSTFDA
jgi:hypothetical protein